MTDADERNVARSIGVNEIPATYEFIGADNYVDALTGSQFLGTLGWTLVWTVSCVSITFALGMALANILNRRIAGRSAYRMALILPWAIPGFVSVFAWRFLYNEERGLLNKILGGAVHRRRAVAERPDLGQVRGHRRQRLARHPVHDGRPPRRTPVHPLRAVRGGGDGRRDRLAALPPHHTARTAPGLHHGDPALHHLDLQHVPGDLPADPRRTR